MTVIRDLNGNRLEKTLRHYMSHAPLGAGLWHKDSTGLYCCDYVDDKDVSFCAFIRPETMSERKAVIIATKLGKPRP